MTDWRKNPGYLPTDLAGTGARVFVRLINGHEPAQAWPADGRQACVWARRNFAFDIAEFRKA